MVVVCNYVVMNKVMLYFSFFILYVCHVCVCVCECMYVFGQTQCNSISVTVSHAVISLGLLSCTHSPQPHPSSRLSCMLPHAFPWLSTPSHLVLSYVSMARVTTVCSVVERKILCL